MQPIQMTRAEYEKKYGVKPVFSTSTLDTTPTKVRMTREEYNQIYGPEKKNAVLENINPLSQTNVNRITDIPSDIKESFSGIKEAGQTAAKSVSDIWKNKDLNVVQKSAATLPGILSGAANMAGTAALAPVKLFTTDEFEKNVAKKFSSAVSSTLGAKIPGADKSMTEIYDSMSDDDKFIVSKLFAPVANVVTSVTTAGKAVPLAEQSVKTVAKNVPDVGATLKKASDNFSFRGEEKALRSVVDEIAKVEEKYAPIRKSNKFAKDVEGSRTRIAQSDVLSKAVDESGKINGEVASKMYKQMTIDDTEGLVRNLLKDENAVISIDSLKEVMENTILKSRLEGNDLVRALDSIEGELKGLRIRGDEAGNIPLYKVHDAKISATDGINYLSPATDKAYRKAIAKTYRQVVEKESKIEMDVDGKKATVVDVNKQLSMYLDDIRRIKALDGRIVDRGKLGKYASSLAGTGIGMAVGSLGGPLAAAAGGAIGGKVASKITSTSMQNTFKKGIKGGVPEDKILKAAKLRVADKPLVAPEGVPKTKAIKEIEDLIKKNVEMQKAAIKANDFTLVAKLKEIYAKLVTKLKEQVTLVRENLRNEQGFVGEKPKNYRNKSADNAIGDISKTTPEKMAADLVQEDIPMANKLMTKKWEDIDNTERVAFMKKYDLTGSTEGTVKPFLREALDAYDRRWSGVEEAKGKTLEEFVKKQITLYHGSLNKIDEFTDSSIRPTFLTKDKKYADVYTYAKDGSGKRGSITGVSFNPEKILDTATDETARELYNNDFLKYIGGGEKLKAGEKIPFTTADDFYVFAKGQIRKGNIDYDAILVDEGKLGGDAFVPLDVSKIKTRTQLTDIWNKANNKAGNSTLLEEAKKYKSAEEFVNAQGTPVYHGGKKSFSTADELDVSNGFYTLKKTDSDTAEYTKYISEPENRRITKLSRIKDENLLSSAEIKEIEGMPTWDKTPEQETRFTKLAEKAWLKSREAEGMTDASDIARYNRDPATAFGKEITEFVVDFKNPLVVDYNGKGWREGDTLYDTTSELIAEAKKNKNDGIVIKNINEGFTFGGERAAGVVDDYIVIDKNTIKTRTQLTDIWNKANNKAGNSTLLEEAKKYKSAEEFVKAQGAPVYHGTSAENAKGIFNNGFALGKGKGVSGTSSNDFIYVTPSKTGANKYVSDRLGIKEPTVIESTISGKTLVIPGNNWDFEAFGEASKRLGVPLKPDSRGNLTMLDMPAIKSAMEEQGFGSIAFKDRGANGSQAVAVLPGNIKTKSQLTDIWKEANRKASDVKSP